MARIFFSDTIMDVRYTKLKLGKSGGLPPSQMKQWVFHEDGDMTLRMFPDMGPGFRFEKERVDGMVSDSVDEFVKLLATIEDDIVVDFFPEKPQAPTRDSQRKSMSRPTYSKVEQSKRRAHADATLVSNAAQTIEARVDMQRTTKNLAVERGGFACFKTNDNGISMCIHKPFLTSAGLERHQRRNECTFGNGNPTTADDFQRLYLHQLEGNVLRPGGSRLDAARNVDPNHPVMTAKNRSYFSFTLSDDSSQDAPHLLMHKFAAFANRSRIPELRDLQRYICKTDGTSIYASAIAKLALRVMHLVKPDLWPRCFELLQSIAGDGKAGPD